jgi:hypothetical protein
MKRIEGICWLCLWALLILLMERVTSGVVQVFGFIASVFSFVQAGVAFSHSENHK